MLPVNLVSLALVRRALHREGQRARDLIDFSWRRLGTDVLWGLLWLAVLWVPFVLAVMGVMFALYGANAFASFQTVFYDPDSAPTFDHALLAVLAIVSVVTFAPLNAPVEELVYRGYSQGGLVRRWPAAWAMVGAVGDLRRTARVLRGDHRRDARLPRRVLRVGRRIRVSSCSGSDASCRSSSPTCS